MTETATTPQVSEPWVTWTPGTTLDVIERRAIMECLSFHKNNRTYACKALGISLRTLRNKLSRYRVEGHDVPDPRLNWINAEETT